MDFFTRRRFTEVQSRILKLERLCKEGKIFESEKEDKARELSMLYFQRRNLSRKLGNVTNGLR